MMKAADRDGGDGRRVGTRERILDAALVLFNDKGPDRVTTAEIARTVGINEGNLYYHFKTKEALLAALFQTLEADASTFMVDAGSNSATHATIYVDFMRRWFLIVWAHRYIFRDLPRFIALAPSLKEPTRALNVAMRLAVEGMLRQMAEVRLIAVPDGEEPELLANVWIVSIYWPVYLSLQEGVDDLGPEHLAWGLKQVASLFRPYLSDEAKRALQALIDRPVV